MESSAGKTIEVVGEIFKTDYSPKNELSDTQVQTYAQYLTDYADGADISAAFVLANSSDTDPYVFPKGQVILHPVDAVVKSVSINPGLYSYLVMSKILEPKEGEEDYNVEFFRKKLKEIEMAVPQYSSMPPQMHNKAEDNLNDIDHWTPELGKNGFVAVLEKKAPNGRSEDSTFYIAVKASVDKAVNQFLRDFSDPKNPKRVTYEDLIKKDMKHAYLKSLGERNARRAAFKTAEALGVRIKHTDDHKAYTRRQEAKPLMAIPIKGDIVQPLSSFEFVETEIGELVANMSMAVAPKRVKSQSLLLLDPYEGIVGLKMNPKFNGTKPTIVKSVGIPVCTGRTKHHTKVLTKGRSMKKRVKGVTWEEKDNGEINDRLAPDAYRSYDKNFELMLSKIGLDVQSWGTVRYTPVIMKISNRKIQRE